VKVLFGKSPFQLQWRDAPVPKPQSGQVLVRIEAGGICGTDLHFLRNNEDWTPLGHEVVGIIEQILLHIFQIITDQAISVGFHCLRSYLKAFLANAIAA